ncbi:Hypothetical predicted protein [Mytilus galloprovincialis]|uniref:Uncharacterized protein n=1 Tax=Mytilus galloprovincialis TaxID=29158 RepID=A0A8B6DX42_MYTGA|nr:Hypothetical predicted protein [Mytilus galloprovincialis]
MNTFQSEQGHHEPEFAYPQFKNIQQRISSYADWPEFAKQAPTNLAKSGLFYTGENDIVHCFCCNIGFAEWSEADNPWTEHARHNPKCWFLRREKGQRFIDSTQEEWKKICNGNKSAFDDLLPRFASFEGLQNDIEKKPEDSDGAGFALTDLKPWLCILVITAATKRYVTADDCCCLQMAPEIIRCRNRAIAKLFP